MRTAAIALRDLLARIAAWFGIEGAFLVLGGVFLSVWAYYAVDNYAPWAIIGGLFVLAWLALTTRRV